MSGSSKIYGKRLKCIKLSKFISLMPNSFRMILVKLTFLMKRLYRFFHSLTSMKRYLFSKYKIHKRRLFQIFDYENQGFLDWNNFFTTISICYFAAEQIMTVIMFMIFDEALSLELTRNQVYLLAQLNDFCLKNQR